MDQLPSPAADPLRTGEGRSVKKGSAIRSPVPGDRVWTGRRGRRTFGAARRSPRKDPP